MKIGRGVPKTLQVEEYLREHEFSRRSQIAEALRMPVNKVSIALTGLWKYKAVDVVIESNGVGWWFVTPETDTRMKKKQQTLEHRKSRTGLVHKKHVHTRKQVKS